jgi:hypothetical protein
MSDNHDPENNKPNLMQQVGSVLAAFFGVQSNKSRERDFTSGSASTFIVLGIVLTIVFILTVYGIVKLVTSLAGV